MHVYKQFGCLYDVCSYLGILFYPTHSSSSSSSSFSSTFLLKAKISYNFVLISIQPGATTRKGVFQVERQNSEISYYADDEDGNRNKYAKRGK